MKEFKNTKILCLGALTALALTACSDSSESAVNYGTTEEKNARWDEPSNLRAWNVMDGSKIKLTASTNAMTGNVTFGKSSGDDLVRAGVAYNVADENGKPTDLTLEGEGLCVGYKSDFDVEVRLDTADFESASAKKNLPYVSLAMEKVGNETSCVSWMDFKKKNAEKSSGADAAKKVRSVQFVFVGKSGKSGDFTIRSVSPYVRSDLWFGKDGSAKVETGFDDGDEGTSGIINVIEDSSSAYISWKYASSRMSFEDIIFDSEGLEGWVTLEKSDAKSDVGFEFLVAGEAKKEGKTEVLSANVLDTWKGMCLEYESGMDMDVEFIPSASIAKSLKDSVLKATLAKNDDMEYHCFEFADLLAEASDKDASEILKNLVKIRIKLLYENSDSNNFEIRRISSLLPENLSVKEYGEGKEIKTSGTSEYKSGTSFLWDGAVDGDKVNTGIENAKDGGIWTNSPEETDTYVIHLPEDVEPDDNGNFVSAIIDKHHSIQGYVKSDEDIYDAATFGFNTVSSKLEPADISAWGGFCIHYKAYSEIRIALVTDASSKEYWYADVDDSDDMVWGKVSWEVFKNTDKKSTEKIEDALAKVSAVQLRFIYDGEVVVDRFGSYDQCGK